MTLTLVAAAPEARGRGPSLGVGKGHPGMETAPTPRAVVQSCPLSGPFPLQEVRLLGDGPMSGAS